MAVPQGERRLGHIDALRGIAALCVLVAHCCETVISGLPPGSAAAALIRGLGIEWFDLGRFGVVLFFLISGLVIPFSLRGDQALEKFAIGRFFRLYPAYWLSMLVTVAVAAGIDGDAFTSARIAANATMVPGLLGQDYVSGVYWTLFVELVFYVACAALFAVGLLRNAEIILLVGLGCVGLPIAGLAAHAIGIGAPVIYLTAHLSFLFAGYLIRMALLDGHMRARFYAAVLTVVALAAMPILAAQPDHRFTVSTPLGVTLAALAAVAVFVVVTLRPFKPSRALLWCGSISYSVYLFHIPATHLVRSVLPSQGGVAMLAFFVATCVLTIAFSSLVYIALERPGIALGRKLAHARRRTPAMEVAP